jgi:pimeloyl-ACP methyl ester carboxylesterase
MRLIVLMIALLGLVGCGEHRPKPVADAKGNSGEVVEADGHQVYFECRGTGSPTVVFLNGNPEASYKWGNLFDQTARLTRACEYDRFGLGLTAAYGPIDSKVRDAHDHVRELEQVLKNGDIHKPYVLVGHSWGGALAVLYAGTHDDVEGVVLVDGSVPGLDAVVHAALPPKRTGESQAITEIRNEVPAKPLDDPEHLDWPKALAEAGTVTSLGDTPLIVISAGHRFTGDLHFLDPVVVRLQSKKQARLSSDSVHVLAPKSSHFVQLDAPDVVLASTRAVVDAVRNHRHLAPCAATFGRLADARCLG